MKYESSTATMRESTQKATNVDSHIVQVSDLMALITSEGNVRFTQSMNFEIFSTIFAIDSKRTVSYCVPITIFVHYRVLDSWAIDSTSYSVHSQQFYRCTVPSSMICIINYWMESSVWDTWWRLFWFHLDATPCTYRLHSCTYMIDTVQLIPHLHV